MRKWIMLLLMGLIAATVWSCGSGGFSGITNVAVTVAPSAVTLASRQTQNFTATVTGTPITAVLWSVQEGNGGSIDSTTGAYTAPAITGTFHVVATSVADPTKKATATVVIGAAAVTPTTATLVEGGTQAFSFSIAGTPSTNIKWTIGESNGGTISTTGVYTAPARTGTFHVFATTNTLPIIQASAIVTVTTNTPAGPATATVQVITSSLSSVGFAFSDSTVKSGTKVTWQNQTVASHCIMWDDRVPTTSPGPGANIPVFAGGSASGAWTAPTVTAQTTYHYHCCIHGPAMAGQITVTP